MRLFSSQSTPARTALDFDQWLDYGRVNGFCSEQFCNTHDGPPLSVSEIDAWDEGYDPCAHMVRLGTPDDWGIDV